MVIVVCLKPQGHFLWLLAVGQTKLIMFESRSSKSVTVFSVVIDLKIMIEDCDSGQSVTRIVFVRLI